VAATTLTVAWLLEKYAVSRLAWLSCSVASIAARSDRPARVEVSGEDEIATLAAGINRMLESVQLSQERRRRTAEEHRVVASFEWRLIACFSGETRIAVKRQGAESR
jgi:methyl-accepting chemotaxis protein